MQAERCALLREDVFDLLIISAPPSILPWSTERMRFLRRYYPSLPLSSIDCGSTLSTIDVSILSETSDQFENSLCVLSNITNQASANQSSTLMASYRQLKNTACDNFWMNCFKLISESDEALEQFVTCLSNFLFSQKASKKKNPIVHSILKLLLPNLFGKDREDILVDVQCLLTLSNPQDLLVRIRQLIKCPFIKSSILPSRLELGKANSRLNDDFRSILEPSRTPSGFRVSLVKFVKFVAENIYKKTDISGLRVDIYGDAMKRGKRDVVRMAFRILDNGIETEQSSTHVFTFAVFDVS